MPGRKNQESNFKSPEERRDYNQQAVSRARLEGDNVKILNMARRGGEISAENSKIRAEIDSKLAILKELESQLFDVESGISLSPGGDVLPPEDFAEESVTYLKEQISKLLREINDLRTILNVNGYTLDKVAEKEIATRNQR